MDLSIVIPTFNGAQRLPAVFEALRRCILHNSNSTVVCDLQCEVVVVDNKSNDDTKNVVLKYQSLWVDLCPVKYCFENKQGAGHARILGVKEPQSDLIGFLDDDNIPEPSWLEAAYIFARDHPGVGAIGSQIHGEFEVQPDESLKPLLAFLAITERGDEPLRYSPRSNLLPPSAGLVVRRKAWEQACPERCILGGRTTASMVTSEDLELLAHLRSADWEIWYNPDMKLRHVISKRRLTREYLIPFFRGLGLSRYVTRMAGKPRWKRSILLGAYLCNDLRKTAIHLVRYGLWLKTDLKAACQMTLFWYSVVSPLYILKNYYSTK